MDTQPTVLKIKQMPIYEYKCSCCKHEWELEQQITADKYQECPRCRVVAGKRQISNSSFILKGDCWASDSYSKKEK